MTYSDLYQDPNQYDEILGNIQQSELDFYNSYIKKAKNILYLGSGTGRLLKKFIITNPNITGVEISPPIAKFSRNLLPHTRILNQDFLKLNLNEKFDLILAPFRFLYHFPSPQFEKSLEVAIRHLAPGGLFIGDNFNPYLPLNRTLEYELNSVTIQGDIFEKVYNHYDHSQKLCKEYIERTDTKTGATTVTLLPWYYHYPEEFPSAKFYGSFTKEEFDPNTSEELIFIITV